MNRNFTKQFYRLLLGDANPNNEACGQFGLQLLFSVRGAVLGKRVCIHPTVCRFRVQILDAKFPLGDVKGCKAARSEISKEISEKLHYLYSLLSSTFAICWTSGRVL